MPQFFGIDIKTPSLLSDLEQKFLQFLQDAVKYINIIESVKQVVSEDFQSIIDECKELTAEQADFVNRAKTLRTRLVRADVVFEFIDEIRTGELKRFVVDQFTEMKGSLTDTLNDVITTGRSIGALRQVSGLLNLFQKILTIWTQIAKVVHALHGIVPVLKALEEKLQQFEDVILSQSSSKVYQTKKGYFRER